MTHDDIQIALKTALQAVSGVDFRWPNAGEASVPCIEVQFAGVQRQGGDLKGGQILRETGTMVCLACSELNIGEGTVNALAESVATTFAAGTKIALTGGRLTINDPPQIVVGFRDGSEWRKPVEVRYVATAD